MRDIAGGNRSAPEAAGCPCEVRRPLSISDGWDSSPVSMLPARGALTRERLGWDPVGPGLIDPERAHNLEIYLIRSLCIRRNFYVMDRPTPAEVSRSVSLR